MPMTTEIRRLGAGWETLQAKVAAYVADMPKGGVTLATFEAECLGAVFLTDRPAVTKALRSKRLLCVTRVGPKRYVLPVDAEEQRIQVAGCPRTDQFVRSVAALMMRLAEALDEAGDKVDRDGRAQIAEAVRQVAVVARRHIEKGLPLADARAALWRAFRADAVKALASRESAFARDSTVMTIAPRKAKRTNAPANQPLIERIALLVERAGTRGISKTTLRSLLPRPRPIIAEIEAVIAELDGMGVVRTDFGRASDRGRPGMRIFHASAPMAHKVNGRFLFSPD